MDELQVTTHRDVALFILNHKRTSVAELEAFFGLQIVLLSDDNLIAPDYRVERVGWHGRKQQPANTSRRPKAEASNDQDETVDTVACEEDTPSDDAQPAAQARLSSGRRRRRRGGESENNQNAVEAGENGTVTSPRQQTKRWHQCS